MSKFILSPFAIGMSIGLHAQTRVSIHRTVVVRPKAVIRVNPALTIVPATTVIKTRPVVVLPPARIILPARTRSVYIVPTPAIIKTTIIHYPG